MFSSFIVNLSSNECQQVAIPVTSLDIPLFNSSCDDRVSSIISFVETCPLSFTRVASSEYEDDLIQSDRIISSYHNRFFREFHREFL